MTMTQLILGCTLGFLVAQGLLYGVRRAFGRRPHPAAPPGERKSIPSAYIRIFIRYAAPVGASVAFVMLGAWALQDYLTAKSTHGTATDAPDVVPAIPDSPDAAIQTPQASATDASAADAAADAAAAAQSSDPYADAQFRVRHHARAPLSLKDTLVQQSEQKARAQLLREMLQHAQRSQYDCEAAERAEKYLKAGLDVWGFTHWQNKYFPVADYPGATVPQCQLIQSAVDPSPMNLTSAVARSTHP